MGMLLGTRRALFGGRTLINALQFNGTSTKVNSGSEAGIDNLADDAFTAEILLRPDTLPGNIYPFNKINAGYTSGWFLQVDSGRNVTFKINCATTDAVALTPGNLVSLANWHHIAVTWDDAGDRKARVYVHGTLANTSAAGVGAIVSDAADTLYLGSLRGGAPWLNAALAWVRISDNIRYAAAFTPPALGSPPAVDANTLLQYNFLEGAGTTLDNAEGTAARDGSITNGTWITVPI